MAGYFLEPTIRNLPYERIFVGECLLKGKKDWVAYQDGKATSDILGIRYRCFFPELEKFLWVKVKGGGSLAGLEEFPLRGIPVVFKGLKVGIYTPDKGGIEFSATAGDIQEPDILVE